MVLKGLNELWDLNLSMDELIHLAAEIGSDTPFFITGGTAMAEGRGEKITMLPRLPENRLVLLVPPFEPVMDKTAKMYGTLNTSDFTDGSLTDELVGSLKNGEALSPYMLYNIFENIASGFFPHLDFYKRALSNAGAQQVHLAGSGPTLFTLVSSQDEGEEIVSCAGTFKGLDTALVVKTAHSGHFLTEFEVREIIAKPICRVKKLPEYKYENWKGSLDEYYQYA